jgi:hypothetical protein
MDIEREYLVNDSLAKEAKFLEEESYYNKERNKRLPAVIKIELNIKTKKPCKNKLEKLLEE